MTEAYFTIVLRFDLDKFVSAKLTEDYVAKVANKKLGAKGVEIVTVKEGDYIDVADTPSGAHAESIRRKKM